MTDHPVPDLAALREKAEAVIGQGDPALPADEVEADAMYVGQIAGSSVIFCLSAPDWLAVLALVATLQARVKLLEGVVEEAVEVARLEGAYRTALDWGAALSVSPAEKEEA